MKTLFLLSLLLLSGILSAQDPEGAWELSEHNGKEITDMEVVQIFQDGYFANGAKVIEGDKFHSAKGGEFTIDGDQFTVVQDFNTKNPELVGKEINFTIKQEGDRLVISDPINEYVWEKISDEENDLTGNWVITGRERNGEMNMRTPGDRRTVKIIGGGRFQWIAFNSATGEFSGTGGGSYTAEDGKYSENIEFFSRDNSRVGASLEFDFEVKDGKWHHRGKSSKGDPIYEVWSPYKEAYNK